MSDSETCLNARGSLEEIRALKKAFETAYDLAVSSNAPGAIEQAQMLKQSLETKIIALQKELATEFAERLFDLRNQYEFQAALLFKAGLVKKEVNTSGTETGILVMTGIDNKDYPIPSYETIVSRIAEQKALLEIKGDQGFTKLILVPFGMRLDSIIERFREYLLAYKKTYDKAHENETLPNVFRLNESDPISVWKYHQADINSTMTYDPVSFGENYVGTTKDGILEWQRADEDPMIGWRVLLLQKGENGKGIREIPRRSNGLIEGRHRQRYDIEAGNSLTEYLEDRQFTLGNPHSPYDGEFDITLEEWFVIFMTHLEETGKMMDGNQNGAETLPYLIGAFFGASKSVPIIYWREDIGQIWMDRVMIRNSTKDEKLGIRSAVRV